MTNKTARFLFLIHANPGITTAEVHRRLGKYYAHGHHKYTYQTVNRMLSNGLIEACEPAPGLTGGGLRVKTR